VAFPPAELIELHEGFLQLLLRAPDAVLEFLRILQGGLTFQGFCIRDPD